MSKKEIMRIINTLEKIANDNQYDTPKRRGAAYMAQDLRDFVVHELNKARV